MNERALRRALRRELGRASRAAIIEVAPEVPGLTVFSAYDPEVPQRRITGVFDGKRIERDFRTNLANVLTALGFDGSSQIPATHVAQVLAMLEGDPGTAITDPGEITRSRPELGLTLPRYDTIDDRPAIEYWVTTARMAPWRTTVIAQPDGSFDYRRGGPDTPQPESD